MRAVLVLSLLLLAGCSFEPKYVRPVPAVAAALPGGGVVAAPVDRAAFFADPVLRGLIDRALANNQDLRATLANVEAARAQYRVQRANEVPLVTGGAGASVREGSATGQGSVFSVDVGTNAFELDLFGRVRSLSNAALDSYLASEAGARAVRLGLVGEVANAYLTLAADRALLAIARDTRDVAASSVRLTRARLAGGVAPRGDLRQAETVLAGAELDILDLTTRIAQDGNALERLVGGAVPETERPVDLASVEASVRAIAVPLQSSVLLRRPDVVEAEYRLRAAGARIGAARAAFFPRLSLTGIAGFASQALGALFTGGAFGANAGASASLPIFDGGANRGNLAFARANQDAALASYQAALQTAFRQTADVLARRATTAGTLDQAARLEAAARDAAFLADARYRGGVDSFLTSLDAQRSLYAARRTRTAAILVAAQNRLALWQVLGGDEGLDVMAR